MEKNRIRPVHVGKGVRMSYSQQKEVLEYFANRGLQWQFKPGICQL